MLIDLHNCMHITNFTYLQFRQCNYIGRDCTHCEAGEEFMRHIKGIYKKCYWSLPHLILSIMSTEHRSLLAENLIWGPMYRSFILGMLKNQMALSPKSRVLHPDFLYLSLTSPPIWYKSAEKDIKPNKIHIIVGFIFAVGLGSSLD